MTDSSWRLFSFSPKVSPKKKSQPSTKPPPSPKPKPPTPTQPPDVSVARCLCCNHLLATEPNIYKFRCSTCDTTTEMGPINLLVVHQNDSVPHLLSHKYIAKAIGKCLDSSKESQSLHQVFAPLCHYLHDSFSSQLCLNNSFKLNRNSSRPHYSSSNVDRKDIHRFFGALTALPTKRPLYTALSAASHSLRRLNPAIMVDVRNLHWVLVLMEIPFLSRSLTHSSSSSASTMVDVVEIRTLCYDIVKRTIGILAHTENYPANNYIASWLSKLPRNDFELLMNLINLYITFHLKNYFYMANNPLVFRRKSASGPRPDFVEDSDLKQQMEHSSSINSLSYSLSQTIKPPSNGQDTKIKIHLYGNDWHLKRAAVMQTTLLKANSIRKLDQKLPVSRFYNSLVDFVNMKLDFESWQSSRSSSRQRKDSVHPELQTVIDYISGKQNVVNEAASFFFCMYPFLISLGMKISILEYEARKQMERKAEEAFINALDKKIALDIYFKVIVRREYIVQDSLKSIRANSANLKKSLRVQFVNEPGVDAGGLKKEWFLLLTRSLFSPQTGMLYNVEDSNYLWFSLSTIDNAETYYLFGSILGLAIYNSTILELKFPLTLYKILLGQSISLLDYQELFPEACKNLSSLRQYNEQELSSLDIFFEVSYYDVFKQKTITKDLVPNGKNIKVSTDNREQYIDKYSQFFLADGLRAKLTSFVLGFSNVIGGNALLLFLPEEIQLLLCGSADTKLDIDVLKSITKYQGWTSREEATKSPLVEWIWTYLESQLYEQQKKFLLFVTGSDRVPATGIQNLTFKISRHKGHGNRLPEAHTCFNELVVYDYGSIEILTLKLNQAVNGSAGFGIK